VQVVVNPGADVDGGRLVLPTGQSIRGCVIGADRFSSPLKIRAQRGEGVFSIGLLGIGFDAGRPVITSTEAAIDDRGGCGLYGLEAGTHELEVVGIGSAEHHPDLLDRFRRVADAPCAGVDFSLEMSCIEVEVTKEGAAVPRASISIEGRVCLTRFTDASGKVAVHVVPREPYVIRVGRGETSEEQSRRVVSPPPSERGVEIFELRPRHAGPGIAVRLVVPEGAPVPERAGFGLFRAEDRTPAGKPAVIRNVPLVDGGARLLDLEPGRWRVVVRPGATWWMSLGYWLPSEAVVEVPEAGEAPVRIPVRIGGRIQVAPHRSQEDGAAPRIVVRSSSGTVVVTRFVRRAAVGPVSATAPDPIYPE
jgi:hypothetical protein